MLFVVAIFQAGISFSFDCTKTFILFGHLLYLWWIKFFFNKWKKKLLDTKKYLINFKFQFFRFSSLFSFDVRGRSFAKALLWSDSNSFGSRAYFLTVSRPAGLNVDNVHLDDEGVSISTIIFSSYPAFDSNCSCSCFPIQVYRCRVDFQNSPTRNHRINLTVTGKFP